MLTALAAGSAPCSGGADPTKIVPAQETPIGPIIRPPETNPLAPSKESPTTATEPAT
jgi:hypothetical protein